MISPKAPTPGIVILTAILNFVWALASLLFILWMISMKILVVQLGKFLISVPENWQFTMDAAESGILSAILGWVMAFVIVFLILNFVAALLTGIGLLKAKRAAWYAQVALSVVGLFLFPLGTFLNVIILLCFFQERVRVHFRI